MAFRMRSIADGMKGVRVRGVKPDLNR